MPKLTVLTTVDVTSHKSVYDELLTKARAEEYVLYPPVRGMLESPQFVLNDGSEYRLKVFTAQSLRGTECTTKVIRDLALGDGYHLANAEVILPLRKALKGALAGNDSISGVLLFHEPISYNGYPRMFALTRGGEEWSIYSASVSDEKATWPPEWGFVFLHTIIR